MELKVSFKNVLAQVSSELGRGSVGARCAKTTGTWNEQKALVLPAQQLICKPGFPQPGELSSVPGELSTAAPQALARAASTDLAQFIYKPADGKH